MTQDDAKNVKELRIPSLELIEAELNREKRRNSYGRLLKNVLISLLAVAAAAVLIAMLMLPVLQINGSSMSETLESEDVVIAVSGSEYESGDVIAFYYNNNILVKRVIATSGQWVNMDEEGNVYVDDQLLDEPYVSEKSLGECNMEFPYQVPDGKCFVMGDHRATSVDSRNKAVGCVSDDKILGKVFLRVWPLTKFSVVH